MRKIGWIGLLLCCMGIFSGCGKKEEVQVGKAVEVYYLNKEETKISSETYIMQNNQIGKQIEELLQVMAQPPKNVENKAAISSNITVLDAVIAEEQLVLTVDESYRKLEPVTEVLTRAAIVRTLTQIDGIDYVTMNVREQPLTDLAGNPIGIMSAAMFVDNAGNEINAYERARLTLYYADSEGTELIETTKSVVFNTNISMEKLVMEELIKGPGAEGIYPTINPATKINNVTVKDGICYVNLNEAFLTHVTNTTSQVTIYSIVNSLVELPNVNKVQISVNGNTEGAYRKDIPLSTIFERNLELKK